MSSIAELLAVSERTVERWTKDARRDEKEQLRRDVVDAWLDCSGSNREIAERFGIDHKSAAAWGGEWATDVGNSPPESRQHFDIWQFHSADDTAGRVAMTPGAAGPLRPFPGVAGVWQTPRRHNQGDTMNPNLPRKGQLITTTASVGPEPFTRDDDGRSVWRFRGVENGHAELEGSTADRRFVPLDRFDWSATPGR